FLVQFNALRKYGFSKTLKMLATMDQAKIGNHVGTDALGNEYYENKDDLQNRDRWVIYKKWNFDGTQVPAEWHQWLSHVTDDTPDKFAHLKPFYQSEHIENVTGTKGAFKTYSTVKPKIESWNAEVKPRA
ncbi:hypothetical protein HK098_007825, partial [Nowakowskiella sp. JEL0407]